MPPRTVKKIVIADDESHILQVLALKLGKAGYEVITAMDGEEAFELIQSELPDAVITDMQMPKLTGLELCHMLRQLPATREIPVVMLTARGYALKTVETEAAGIRHILSKPFSPRQIVEIVEQLVGDAEPAGNKANDTGY